jgi:hypothetical protein
MSDQDQDSSKWQLGMQLPSRKETHGRKKKSDRKLDKQPQAKTESPKVESRVEVQPVELQQTKEPQPVEAPAPKRTRQRVIEAVPEDPKYALPWNPLDAGSEVEREVGLDATPNDAVPDDAVSHSEEATKLVLSQQTEHDASGLPAPERETDEPSEDKQEAIEQLQAYWNESAATIALPAGGVALGSHGGELQEDQQYLRELLLQPHAVKEEAARHEFAVQATAVAIAEAIPEATAEATPDEEDDAPVISKWKIALLILTTPIVLVIVLAWGKLAYVHQVPSFVQQQVPAYQHGQGFLILKPWWFGPPIFTLDQYERTDGEDFEHWKIQLNDYETVVQDPTVLYTFPDDILK